MEAEAEAALGCGVAAVSVEVVHGYCCQYAYLSIAGGCESYASAQLNDSTTIRGTFETEHASLCAVPRPVPPSVGLCGLVSATKTWMHGVIIAVHKEGGFDVKLDSGATLANFSPAAIKALVTLRERGLGAC